MANGYPLANFGGAFLQAFTTARNNRLTNELRQKLLDVTISTKKKQLEQVERQNAAISGLAEAMLGTAQPGEEMGAMQPAAGAKGASLTDILADPQLLSLALQSGSITLPQAITAQQQGAMLGQTGQMLGMFGQGIPMPAGVPGAATPPTAMTYPPTAGAAAPPTAPGMAAAGGGGVAQAGQLAPVDLVVQPGKFPAFKFARTGPGAAVKNTRLNPQDPSRVDELDQFGNVVRTRQATGDELLKVDRPVGDLQEAAHYVNPDTLKLANPMMTPRQLSQQGFVYVTDKQKDAMVAMSSINAIVDSIDQMANQMIWATTPGQVAEQGIRLTGGQLLRTNPIAKTYDDSKQAFLGVLARGLGGERGVLTDRDIKRVEAMLPGLTDTVAIRDLKMGLLKNLMEVGREANLGLLKGLGTPTQYGVRMRKLIEDAEKQIIPLESALGLGGTTGPALPPDKAKRLDAYKKRLNQQ